MDHLDVERVEVADDQPVAVEQQFGEVADPTAGLEHRTADVRGDLAVHPAIERFGVAYGDEDCITVVGREAGVEEPAMDQRPDRLQSVAPSNLFAFNVRPTGIADR